MMDHGVGNRWWLAISIGAICAVGLTSGTMPSAHADPTDDAQVSPFPELAHIEVWYDQIQPDEFFIPDRPDVWFLTPTGLNCGIWRWGSFGCTGDLPGAPPDAHHIAWFNGNRAVHYGWTAAIQFPAGQAQRTLPPRSYVTYEGTTCAVTPDSNTYCGHGASRFLMTPQGTWFKGWDDRRSYVCNAYGTCPP